MVNVDSELREAYWQYWEIRILYYEMLLRNKDVLFILLFAYIYNKGSGINN